VSPESRPLIAIVDYGMGNRRSVEKALEHVGAEAVISAEHDVLRGAAALVLPGVGAFPRGMSNLRAAGLDEVLRTQAAAGVPLLGICLGMQLLLESSDELGMATPGLGLIGGQVRRLESQGLRIPHIGWNEVRFERPCELTADLPPQGAPFYHVHSYAAAGVDEAAVIGTAEYGERFPTMIASGRVYGTQFHPEKSSRDGLLLLSAFTQVAARASRAAVSA
jgi:glutamine amidotransferase